MNVFIAGPGWTRTKTHDFILNDKDVSAEKFRLTKNFLEHKKGTDLEDIYQCIRWLSAQGKDVAGGRNFSVVNDEWRGPHNVELARALRADTSMFKLRRFKNDYGSNSHDDRHAKETAINAKRVC
jgi:hypothetical protein